MAKLYITHHKDMEAPNSGSTKHLPKCLLSEEVQEAIITYYPDYPYDHVAAQLYPHFTRLFFYMRVEETWETLDIQYY